MHALVLKSLGHDVCVIESRSEEEMHARAAGLSLWHHAQKLVATFAHGTDIGSIASRNLMTQIMSGSGLFISEAPVSDNVRTSTWTTVHKHLQNACKKKQQSHGKIRFETGKTVHQIIERNGVISVAYKDNVGMEKVLLTSLVIAADGARSATRKYVLPGVMPEYAGYLAWRGTVAETDAPEELKGALNGYLVFFMLEGGYILTYDILISLCHANANSQQLPHTW